MKTIRSITMCMLFAALAMTINPASAASTGELLQQGLYAEEVEGNMESAIKAYAQIINDPSAPANHVAQALYRQGMCYMKLKDEAAARTALEKLVTDYSSQTEIVEKARPILDELMDFDPASLMPPETLIYMEFGSPGKQVETILTMLKGTPFENPLTIVAGPQGNNNNQKSPGDIVGALLNPSMMAEFKKIRSSAVGILGIEQNHPKMISVLYPGKSDALRGLILAGLGMAGKPGDSLEGLQTVNLPQNMAVAYDDKVVIMAQPASLLEWSVKQYKGKINEPTLASSKKSFGKLSKTQRQKNVLTLWANVDDAYAQALKLFPAGHVPPQLLAANAIVDFGNIDDLVLTEAVEPDGTASKLEFQFKDGHHCLAYDLIRTPNIGRAALDAVPSEAVAIASFSMNQSSPSQTEKVRAQLQNITGLDIGREIFSNIEQVTLFAMPAAANSTNTFLPAQLGMAITSHNPDQTRQVLHTLLGTINPGVPAQNGRYRISKAGQPDIYCNMAQANGFTLLSLNPWIIEASTAAIKNHKSVLASGSLNKSVAELAPGTSKALLVNAGGAIRLLGPTMKLPELSEDQAGDLNNNLEQIARAAAATTIEFRTDEQLNSFAMNWGVKGLPALSQIIVPATHISQLLNKARAEAASRELRRERPAIVMQATKPPVIDGNEDEVWKNVPRNQIANVLSSFGSGEKASQILSPDDLSANFRALWDKDNLYLLVEVTDDHLVNDTSDSQSTTVPTGSTVIPWWYDDGIEVYLDADNAKPSEYGPNDAQYHFDWDKTKPTMGVHNQHGHLENVEFAMVTTDKGYRTEIKFPWATLRRTPFAGASIGLDVQVNDDDDGGQRDSKIAWHDTRDQAWQNPQAFGNAELAGLVGWWKFDETQGTTASDSSGGKHDGTLEGNARWAKGKFGGAIDLDGTGSFVRIADKAAFDFGAQVSVSCWVNFRTVPAMWTGIITKGDSAWRLSTFEQETKLHFAANSFTRGGNDVFVNSPTMVNTGEWHHVVGTYDGEMIKIYVDGKLDSSRPWTGGLGRDDFDVLIGENAEQTNRCFNGLIDDVRIYNYALPEADIKALAEGQ